MFSVDFPPEGPFKILQFTDLHLGNRPEKDALTYALVEDMVNDQAPDLLVFTGDIFTKDEAFQPTLIAEACRRIDAFKTPWAFCMGNHEGTHGQDGVRAQKAAFMVSQSQYLLFDSGPKDVYGIGNYAISLKKHGKPAWTVFLLDSNDFTFHMIRGVPSRVHDAIRPDQIAWFQQTADTVRNLHGPVPAVAFFHVPVPEFIDAAMFEPYLGDRGQKVTTPPLNTGFFAAALAQRDLRAMFVGHDHTNSFCADVLGIPLAYGRCSGYGCNAPAQFPRGARVILLSPDESLETYPLLHRPKQERGSRPAVYRPEEKRSGPVYDRFHFFPQEKMY
jgi:hypothetical protein